jgi:hypothetical protein
MEGEATLLSFGLSTKQQSVEILGARCDRKWRLRRRNRRYPDKLLLTGLRLGSGTVVLLALVSTCRSTAATGATAALFHSAGLRLGSGTILVLLVALASTFRSTAATGVSAALCRSADLRLGSGTILVLLARTGTTTGRAGSAAAACAGSAAARAGSPGAGATAAATATGTSTAARLSEQRCCEDARETNRELYNMY